MHNFNLCNDPSPNNVSREFDGWYDVEGKYVDLICRFFSFAPVLRNPDGSFGGYTGKPVARVLTAHWVPNLSMNGD